MSNSCFCVEGFKCQPCSRPTPRPILQTLFACTQKCCVGQKVSAVSVNDVKRLQQMSGVSRQRISLLQNILIRPGKCGKPVTTAVQDAIIEIPDSQNEVMESMDAQAPHAAAMPSQLPVLDADSVSSVLEANMSSPTAKDRDRWDQFSFDLDLLDGSESAVAERSQSLLREALLKGSKRKTDAIATLVVKSPAPTVYERPPDQVLQLNVPPPEVALATSEEEQSKSLESPAQRPSIDQSEVVLHTQIPACITESIYEQICSPQMTSPVTEEERHTVEWPEEELFESISVTQILGRGTGSHCAERPPADSQTRSPVTADDLHVVQWSDEELFENIVVSQILSESAVLDAPLANPVVGGVCSQSQADLERNFHKSDEMDARLAEIADLWLL